MNCISSRCDAGGYQWKMRFYPAYIRDAEHWVALDLVFLSEASARNAITANLSCRPVDPCGNNLSPWEGIVSVSATFQRASDLSQPVWVKRTSEVEASGNLKSDSLTVCDLKAIPLPVCDLPQHLGKLLQSGAGADVTLVVSGKSFVAHKSILAARSPVFMAEFFGEMEETSSPVVDVQDMDATVFQAMLQFIYTGKVPELDEKEEEATILAQHLICRVPEIDEKEEEATILAQHLIAAADRYMIDRLKLMCERRLAFGINVNTAATTLALAEQHCCSQLKAKCIEFIAGGSPETLRAVLATDGYKHLENCSASVVTELLMASHARKN
ncbi:unnamed protein product [Urochloa decumbens]|uniref:BTB domain-containing protein n=1 Tax=Urochloa decumbens TaxID=240449 RepID=A0ABC8VK25_9POAL